jgi:hypothetical protein
MEPHTQDAKTPSAKCVNNFAGTFLHPGKRKKSQAEHQWRSKTYRKIERLRKLSHYVIEENEEPMIVGERSTILSPHVR